MCKPSCDAEVHCSQDVEAADIIPRIRGRQDLSYTRMQEYIQYQVHDRSSDSKSLL